MLLVMPRQFPRQQMVSVIFTAMLSLSGTIKADPYDESSDLSTTSLSFPLDSLNRTEANSIRSISEEIEYLTDQIGAMVEQNECTDGTAAMIYTVLGIMVTGITNNILLTYLQPTVFPFDGYEGIANSQYARAALAGLANYVLPAIFVGAGTGAMTNAGTLPAIPENETRKPLLLGTAISGALTVAHTLLSALTPSSLITIPLSKTPDTVALLNMMAILVSTSIYFGWERINKEQQYHHLMLKLKHLEYLEHRLPAEDESDDA